MTVSSVTNSIACVHSNFIADLKYTFVTITALLHLQPEGLFDEQMTQLRCLLQIYADSSQCLVQIWLPLFPSNN